MRTGRQGVGCLSKTGGSEHGVEGSFLTRRETVPTRRAHYVPKTSQRLSGPARGERGEAPVAHLGDHEN